MKPFDDFWKESEGRDPQEKIANAVKEYAEKDFTDLDIRPDPKVRGSYAIKVRYEGDDYDTFFLIRAGDPIGPDSLEEVEFTQWPPTSGKLRYFGV